MWLGPFSLQDDLVALLDEVVNHNVDDLLAVREAVLQRRLAVDVRLDQPQSQKILLSVEVKLALADQPLEILRVEEDEHLDIEVSNRQLQRGRDFFIIEDVLNRMQQLLMLIHHIVISLIEQRQRLQDLLPGDLDEVGDRSETVAIQSILALHKDLLELCERLRVVDEDIISEHSIGLLNVLRAGGGEGQLDQFHNPALI